jgi:hypothetical protein
MRKLFTLILLLLSSICFAQKVKYPYLQINKKDTSVVFSYTQAKKMDYIIFQRDTAITKLGIANTIITKQDKEIENLLSRIAIFEDLEKLHMSDDSVKTAIIVKQDKVMRNDKSIIDLSEKQIAQYKLIIKSKDGEIKSLKNKRLRDWLIFIVCGAGVGYYLVTK